MNAGMGRLIWAALLMGVLVGAPPAKASDYFDPMPGYYRIRGLDSQLCLSLMTQAGFESPHLILRRCDEPNMVQFNYLAIVPTGILNQFTIRPFALSRMANLQDRTRLDYCVTKARGVVAGLPRTDVLPCDFRSNEASWCQVGGEDQRFMFVPVVGGPRPSYRIAYYNGRLDVRFHSRDAGSDILIVTDWTAPSELFELVFDRPLDTADDIACLPPPIDPRRVLGTPLVPQPRIDPRRALATPLLPGAH